RPPTSARFPYTPLFRSEPWGVWSAGPEPELVFRLDGPPRRDLMLTLVAQPFPADAQGVSVIVGGRMIGRLALRRGPAEYKVRARSEEHTFELQSPYDLV